MDFKTEAGKKLLDERTTKLGVSYFIRETWLGELCPPVIEAQLWTSVVAYLQIAHKEAKKEKAKNNDNNNKKK